MRAQEFIVQDKNKEFERLVADILEIAPQAYEIWFYGSRARGDHKPSSDYDILVMIPDSIVGGDFLDLQLALEKLSAKYNNFDVQASHSWNMISRSAREEGRLIWKNKSIIENSGKYKFLRPGELRGSYTDSQLRALGFRQSQSGSWYIAVDKWNELVRTNQISESESLVEKRKRNKRKSKTRRIAYGGWIYGYPAASGEGGEGGGDGGVAEGTNNITYKQQKGKNKFSIEMSVDGKSAGIFQYDADTGRTLVELDPSFRGQGLGQRLILKGIYTAAMLGMDYVEDESRTQMFDRAMDRLVDAGYIVNDDEYWYVTSNGEQFLKQSVAEDSENYNGIQLSLEVEKDDEYVDDEDTDNQTIYVKATANGRELGHVLFTIDYDSQGMVLNPQDLEVDDRYRGQGIAATMYDYVKSKGYRIRRSGQQTDAGAGFWNKHKPGKNIWEQGVAESDEDDSKKLKGFHQSLGNAVRGRVSQMQANMAILKAQNPNTWLWEPGDIVYSANTGRTYEIVGPWLDSRGTAKYLYRGNDEEQGTFVADRAHQTLKKISGKQGVAEGRESKITVKPSPGKGNGLFATKLIKAGEVITSSKFETISDKDWQLIKNTTPVKLYGFKLGDKHALQQGPFKFKFTDEKEKELWDKTEFKGLSLSGFMFINGADSPDEVNSKEKFSDTTAKMIATKDIQPGEEIIKQYNVPTKGVAENFADGRNPGDKGDSKRYNVPTKGKISTLRKIAKQGGRRGQLAHWMANMRSGKQKDKK